MRTRMSVVAVSFCAAVAKAWCTVTFSFAHCSSHGSPPKNTCSPPGRGNVSELVSIVGDLRGAFWGVSEEGILGGLMEAQRKKSYLHALVRV